MLVLVIFTVTVLLAFTDASVVRLFRRRRADRGWWRIKDRRLKDKGTKDRRFNGVSNKKKQHRDQDRSQDRGLLGVSVPDSIEEGGHSVCHPPP
jgi:hypothetical protein